MHRLITERIVPKLGNPALAPLLDSAILNISKTRLALTTDSFVVKPIFFPGGDIGRLAVCGTINDLAAVGAVPRFLTLALILEEGLPLEVLDRVLDGIAAAASEADVIVATGDTKVVERGAADGMYINTAGIGEVPAGRNLSPKNIQPGDVVLTTGTLGDHGIAVMSRREGIEFTTELVSDVAPLASVMEAMMAAAPSVRCLRDPTRGGAAMTLGDFARESGTAVWIEEARVPIRPEVAGACEMLGIDPLYVASEGKYLVVCPGDESEAALAALRSHPLGRHAARIGEVRAAPAGKLVLSTRIGGRRLVEMPHGEMLPRIC
ncbi:hydrogenase expression/formation protein HypE [bacterium]|nr:hydrogenase expression/formation protein HypE [bacterium]